MRWSQSHYRRVVPYFCSGKHFARPSALVTVENVWICETNNIVLILQALADQVRETDLDVGRLYPPLQSIKDISVKIARAIVEEAYNTGWYFFYFIEKLWSSIGTIVYFLKLVKKLIILRFYFYSFMRKNLNYREIRLAYEVQSFFFFWTPERDFIKIFSILKKEKIKLTRPNKIKFTIKNM